MMKANNMQSESQPRTTWIDNLSGVLITYCVMFYHLPGFIGTGASSFRIVLRSLFGFFIAWFFFKSGMFYKQRSLKEELDKCWRRLIIPFLVINAICILIRIFITKDAAPLEILKVDLYRESDVMCNPLWFCLSLAIVRILYQALSKVRIKLVAIIISFVLAFLLNRYSYHLVGGRIINIPPWVGNIFLGLFFYGLGDILRDYQFKKPFLLLSVIIYIIFLFFPSPLDFYRNVSDNSYLLSVFYDFSAIILFNNIFKSLLNVQVPVLTHVGANSMIYYITHYSFLYLLFMNYNYDMPSWVTCIITIILTAVFLLFMDLLFTKTRIKWLIGN